jgi:hypothetical protein
MARIEQAEGYDGSIIREGTRVELHPGTDHWMRGARYGTIKRIDPFGISIELDRAGTFRTTPDRVRAVD